MTEPHRPRVKYVIGPDGSPLTIADLPAPGTKRWVIRRKAEVVAAVRGGLLSLEEACARYTLTVEEFLSWQYSIDQHGLAQARLAHQQRVTARQDRRQHLFDHGVLADEAAFHAGPRLGQPGRQVLHITDEFIFCGHDFVLGVIYGQHMGG